MMRLPQQTDWQKAFTLAELLISVAILGLLATFLIGKVLLPAIDTTVSKTCFKEFYQIASELQAKRRLGEVPDEESNYDMYSRFLNYKSRTLNLGIQEDRGELELDQYRVISVSAASPAPELDRIVITRPPHTLTAPRLCLVINNSNVPHDIEEGSVSVTVAPWAVGPCALPDNIALYNSLFLP